VAELETAGFRVVELTGIIKHSWVQRPLNRLRRVRLSALATALIALLERVPGREPFTWMAVCEKR